MFINVPIACIFYTILVSIISSKRRIPCFLPILVAFVLLGNCIGYFFYTSYYVHENKYNLKIFTYFLPAILSLIQILLTIIFFREEYSYNSNSPQSCLVSPIIGIILRNSCFGFYISPVINHYLSGINSFIAYILTGFIGFGVLLGIFVLNCNFSIKHS